MSPSEQYEEFGGRWRLHERQRVAFAASAVLITVLMTVVDPAPGVPVTPPAKTSAARPPATPAKPLGRALAGPPATAAARPAATAPATTPSTAPTTAVTVPLPAPATTPITVPPVAPSTAPAAGAGDASPAAIAAREARGRVALDFALAQLGKPYVWGGTGPNSYDCSGLTQRAWRAAGVSIPRTTQQQARFGTAVPLGQIKPGDLVVFYPDASHVGIYAGHGDVVVAPHSGAVVTVQQMKWMPVNTVRRPG